MSNILTLIVLLASCISASAFAESLKVAGNPNDKKLHLTLIKEVVKRSSRFDQIEFIYANTEEPAGSRIMADLENEKLDIIWTATSTDMEQRFTPVHFPIYRGMLGMRIGLIHEKNHQLLANVRNKADLQQYTICSGKTWPDTFIIDANNIKTAKSLKYPNIFEMMLAGNRCHFFARGVMEPFSEVEAHPTLPLGVDSHIMLRYRMPYMLFVKKGNTELQEHLLSIIEEIFADGTYERMFFADKEVKMALSLAKLEQRTIIDLENPYLTEETKSMPQKYFFDPLAKRD
ncbi:ABC transporter substrate-binding protein [Vibrio rotiferianus]|uniref:ABC transporter substrate-binding protein n=1 Tax=Vibrio rotiferianus TaxID=190895 RepID=UPI001110DB06|nr:ABC transporter substrate-binding protein [Vibrio rotiferianus]TMX42050.1 ABC transporter substrate-binding protein [Vibrio rotiferianus]TMX57886.1 ABC transporter substrate-binding protein [Vibrio rotiferianus]TMX68309.1 ABC transporter substrate-binding protein [Vibrio rotiferianus]